jgi:hypothetical protein
VQVEDQGDDDFVVGFPRGRRLVEGGAAGGDDGAQGVGGLAVGALDAAGIDEERREARCAARGADGAMPCGPCGFFLPPVLVHRGEEERSAIGGLDAAGPWQGQGAEQRACLDDGEGFRAAVGEFQAGVQATAEGIEALGLGHQIAFVIANPGWGDDALVDFRGEKIEGEIEAAGVAGAGLEGDAMRGVGRRLDGPGAVPWRRFTGCEALPATVGDAREAPARGEAGRCGLHVEEEAGLFLAQGLEASGEQRRGLVVPEREVGP